MIFSAERSPTGVFSLSGPVLVPCFAHGRRWSVRTHLYSALVQSSTGPQPRLRGHPEGSGMQGSGQLVREAAPVPGQLAHSSELLVGAEA